MANVYVVRAMCIHGVRLMPQYKTQLRLRYSTLSGISNLYFARPGTAGISAGLLQKRDSLYCVGLAPSRCIFTETRLRNPAPERKPDNKVSLKRSAPPASTTQKVKEAGKDLTYLIVVLIGIGITVTLVKVVSHFSKPIQSICDEGCTHNAIRKELQDFEQAAVKERQYSCVQLETSGLRGGLFYVIFKELFSSSSPSKIFGDALKKCRAHPEIIGALGEPIKGYGETSRRGRRRHVSHVEYMKDGVKHIQLKFYIEGSEPIKGIVHLDAKENPESGRYDFRYIFVDFDTYPKRTIIVEDNR